MPKPLTLWITTNFSRDGNTRPPDLSSEKFVCRLEQLELDREQETGSKSGKECIKAVYCLLNFYAEYRNARVDEAQVGIKIARRNINNLRYADDTTLMAESKEELKSLLMKVK